MNTTPILSLLLLSGVCCVACGGGGAQASADADSSAVAPVAPKGPKASVSPQTNTYDATIGAHKYVVSMVRSVDSIAPTVDDGFDQRYYDNLVAVTISRDGQPVFTHTFGKDTFADYLDDGQKQSMVLLGMAYDDELSGASSLVLTAQVGEPCVGEGPAFLVRVPVGSQTFRIERDTRNAADVDGYEAEADSTEQ